MPEVVSRITATESRRPFALDMSSASAPYLVQCQGFGGTKSATRTNRIWHTPALEPQGCQAETVHECGEMAQARDIVGGGSKTDHQLMGEAGAKSEDLRERRCIEAFDSISTNSGFA